MPRSAGEIRQAAATAITHLIRQRGDILSWSEIAAGFAVDGERLLFANKARGIFKPAALNDGAALSIRSSRPSRIGRLAPYDDELLEDGLLRYRLQRDHADNADNRLLRRAHQLHLPLIYFSGLRDAVYQVFFPVFVTGIDNERMEALMAWKKEEQPGMGAGVLRDHPGGLGRRAAVNQLHQARFRANVLSAYDFSCAVSGVRIGSLLTAAPIMPGAEHQGVSAVSNAICMSVLHSSAFAANLIGIDPGLRVRTSTLLNDPANAIVRSQILGSLPARRKIAVPGAQASKPNPDLLAERFKLFEAADK